MFKQTVATSKKNQNALWQVAIQKVMENVKIAFKTIPDGKKQLNMFQYVICHITFDIIMEDLWRKIYLVVDTI